MNVLHVEISIASMAALLRYLLDYGDSSTKEGLVEHFEAHLARNTLPTPPSPISTTLRISLCMNFI